MMETVSYNEYDFFNRDNHFARYENVKSKLLYGRPKKNAQLSIVMPVYNRTQYIRESIESAINQNTTYIYNVIVVDNTEENDSIYDIVKTYSEDEVMYYKNEKNIGMFGNWNRCIELADTPWIAMLHDDDKLMPDYVETILNIITAYPDCVGVGVDHNYINDSSEVFIQGVDFGGVKKLKTKDYYLDVCPTHIAGFAFKKDEAMDIGGFDEDYYPSSDANFMCKLHVLKGNVWKINKTLLQYRVASNESTNPKTLRQFVLYNYIQIKSLVKYMNSSYRFFYKLHQNALIFEGMNSASLFNNNVYFDDIKRFLNYKYTPLVGLYRVALKLMRPYLWERFIRKIKK